jgi:hypothetical protein
MNSASKHKRSGKKDRNKREPSIDRNLVAFLDSRGLYRHGKVPLDFRKNPLDKSRAA